MFCNKLVLIAAIAALALSSISASQQSTIHLHVHSQSKGGAVCFDSGQSPMSVEGIEGVYCVTGQSCVAEVSNGTCPGVEPRLPYGSISGKVKTGVFGCKPAPPAPVIPQVTPAAAATSTCSGSNVAPMSVEGVEGVFCVSGPACAGQSGACPGAQPGLKFGSYCGTVKTGMLDCKPVVSAVANTESDSEDATKGDREDSTESSDERRRRF